MIERGFVADKMKEFQIQEFISANLKNVGHSHTRLQKTPLGEKIIVYTSRPGLVVGKKGENISRLTRVLKKKFKLENPQIEISEIENPNLDAGIVAERIAISLERFGSKRFKGILHKTMEDVLNNGALGVEIILSGKVPSSRAKSWRVFGGYMKKCGEIAVSQVKRAQVTALIKSGIIGIKVSIMPSDVVLPDDIKLSDGKIEIVEEELPAVPVPDIKEEPVKEKKKRKSRAKKTAAVEENKEEAKDEHKE
jgi:small subunit ribosomal protein S3